MFEPLNQQLKALTDINEVTMTLTQRRNLMAQILNDLASAIVQRFPENSVVLPADVSEFWAEAGRIALIHFGLKGEKAWFSVSQWLTSELELNGNIQA